MALAPFIYDLDGYYPPPLFLLGIALESWEYGLYAFIDVLDLLALDLLGKGTGSAVRLIDVDDTGLVADFFCDERTLFDFIGFDLLFDLDLDD